MLLLNAAICICFYDTGGEVTATFECNIPLDDWRLINAANKPGRMEEQGRVGNAKTASTKRLLDLPN